jgi:hypothetical protein
VLKWTLGFPTYRAHTGGMPATPDDVLALVPIYLGVWQRMSVLEERHPRLSA